jgi:hypothetical protein
MSRLRMMKAIRTCQRPTYVVRHAHAALAGYRVIFDPIRSEVFHTYAPQPQYSVTGRPISTFICVRYSERQAWHAAWLHLMRQGDAQRLAVLFHRHNNDSPIKAFGRRQA